MAADLALLKGLPVQCYLVMSSFCRVQESKVRALESADLSRTSPAEKPKWAYRKVQEPLTQRAARFRRARIPDA